MKNNPKLLEKYNPQVIKQFDIVEYHGKRLLVIRMGKNDRYIIGVYITPGFYSDGRTSGAIPTKDVEFCSYTNVK